MSNTDPTRDKLLSLMGAGVPAVAAARAAGVTEAYVSQLLDTEDFRTALIEASAGRLEAAIKHDETVESLEAKTLRIIEQKLPFVRSAMEAAKVFQILNNSKKRAVADPNSSQGAGGTQIVTLVLPKASRTSIKLNSANQVIEVDSRTMAPLPSRELPALQQADAERAKKLLDQAAPMNTVIDGVVRVL